MTRFGIWPGPTLTKVRDWPDQMGWMGGRKRGSRPPVRAASGAHVLESKTGNRRQVGLSRSRLSAGLRRSVRRTPRCCELFLRTIPTDLLERSAQATHSRPIKGEVFWRMNEKKTCKHALFSSFLRAPSQEGRAVTPLQRRRVAYHSPFSSLGPRTPPIGGRTSPHIGGAKAFPLYGPPI
jgi:hypothetical protein